VGTIRGRQIENQSIGVDPVRALVFLSFGEPGLTENRGEYETNIATLEDALQANKADVKSLQDTGGLSTIQMSL
jgi:hypothetical protein